VPKYDDRTPPVIYLNIELAHVLLEMKQVYVFICNMLIDNVDIVRSDTGFVLGGGDIVYYGLVFQSLGFVHYGCFLELKKVESQM